VLIGFQDFVGFDKSVAKVSTACGNDEEGCAVAEGVVGARAADGNNDTVITLFLDEDRVSGLHGTTQDLSPSGTRMDRIAQWLKSIFVMEGRSEP
jgi:hypothetical protein